MDGQTEGDPADQPGQADPAAADAPEVFENRAARRARGKGAPAAHAQTPAKGQRPGGRGSVQGPRQWGNRRSG